MLLQPGELRPNWQLGVRAEDGMLVGVLNTVMKTDDFAEMSSLTSTDSISIIGA